MMDITELVARELERITALRRRLHRIPELGFEEFKTAAVIREELDRLGIAYVAGVEGAATATVAWIGDPAKPCLALRADIDALPIEENTGLSYASEHAGVMHACGHDGHTAALLGAAAVLKQVESRLNACVKLIWQPAEEGGGGGEMLVRAGVLDGRVGPKVAAIFGIHGWPGIPLGVVSTRPGPLMAATGYFEVAFESEGSHAAFPHLSSDPIVTAAEAVMNLQQFVSRETDPTDSVVVSVTRINAGTADNIIPGSCVISGTVRTLSEAMREKARQALWRRCDGVAAANGCEFGFDWSDGYPAVINDPVMTDYVARIAAERLGPDRYIPAARPVMGGEDFAYYLQHVPGCFFMVGVQPPGVADYPGLHTDCYDFADAALATAIQMHVELALGYSEGLPPAR